MDPLIHSLHLALENSSWVVVLSMFATGLIFSLNPCMGAMIPLVLGGSRQTGYKRSLLFIAGFTVTLIILGAIAAAMGKVLTLPASFWTIFLGVLYLIAGMVLLQVRLPVKISGFYITRNGAPLHYFYNQDGLNPWTLGVVFALAPSPCTTPVVLVVSGVAVTTGKILLTALALGFFGLGHSLLLALAFLPGVRKLFRVNLLTRTLRPVLGAILILLSVYFFMFQPDLFDSALLGHNH